MGAELLDRARRGGIEAPGRVGMAADGGQNLLVPLRERDDARIGRLVEADREDAPYARLAGGLDQLLGIRLTKRQVSVAVDHRRPH